MSQPTNTQFAAAVHLLTMLAASPDDTLSSTRLSESVQANPVYIRRVLGAARCAGLVSSSPGANGGWRLAADPATITLAAVWRAVQADDPLLALHDTRPACLNAGQVREQLLAIDRRLNAAVEAELGRTTLADLAPVAAG